MLSARDSATGALLWTRKSQAFEHELRVVDRALIGATGEGALYWVDLETGGTRWRVATEKFFAAGPAIADGVAYIGSQDGVVYAIGLDGGDERWRFRRRHPFGDTVRCRWPGYGDGEYAILYGLDVQPAGSHPTLLHSAGQGVRIESKDSSELWDHETGECHPVAIDWTS
jgi:outer membrane protein assembly factor BamB